MWSRVFEDFGAQNFDIVSPEPLIVGVQNWCQNARKGRFCIPVVKKSKVYLYQKKSYLKKTIFYVV